MATDVDVQFFSHLNGLVLSNNWGDMIRLLDACLVNGVTLPNVTSTSIDEQGDVHLTLFAPHKALLLQVIELSGFEPTSLNQKYRIKGVPSATQLILKPQNEITEIAVTTKGASKLASLGYDIIFRDDKDVKRVYRAKNPTAQHPFIRVDESISDGVNAYSANFAKSAMVGLLERMDHIDDFEDLETLQLPMDTSNLVKNWKITGAGGGVVRGWSRWHYANYGNHVMGGDNESSTPNNGNRNFTLIGDLDCFYLDRSMTPGSVDKILCGCGLFNSALPNDVVPPWFLAAYTRINAASDGLSYANQSYATGTHPFMFRAGEASVQVPKFDVLSRISNSQWATPMMPSYASGESNIYRNNVGALEIPLIDSETYLRGSFKHIAFSGKALGGVDTTPLLSEKSMYVYDSLSIFRSIGGIFFYLGEME